MRWAASGAEGSRTPDLQSAILALSQTELPPQRHGHLKQPLHDRQFEAAPGVQCSSCVSRPLTPQAGGSAFGPLSGRAERWSISNPPPHNTCAGRPGKHSDMRRAGDVSSVSAAHRAARRRPCAEATVDTGHKPVPAQPPKPQQDRASDLASIHGRPPPRWLLVLWMPNRARRARAPCRRTRRRSEFKGLQSNAATGRDAPGTVATAVEGRVTQHLRAHQGSHGSACEGSSQLSRRRHEELSRAMSRWM